MDCEIIVEGKRRRVWPEALKRQIVEESAAPGMTVAQVAQAHDLDPAQVYAWRKAFRERGVLSVEASALASSLTSEPAFVPVHVEASRDPLGGMTPGSGCERIEIALLNGRHVFAPLDMDANALGRLVAALERV